MPIYEYGCQGCGHEWDELQRMSDGPKRKCPACGALKAKRLISRSSFVLKGSGWYVTDYGRGSGGRAGEKKDSAKKDSAKKDSSETKPSKTDD
jgi:putative FmdB family regulatory protein